MALQQFVGQVFDSFFYPGRNTKTGGEQWQGYLPDERGREVLLVPVGGSLRTPTYPGEEWSFLVEAIITHPNQKGGGILAVRLLNRRGYVGSARILEFDFAVRAGQWFAHDEEFQVKVNLDARQENVSAEILEAYFARKGTRVGVINFLSQSGEHATVLLDEDPLEEWKRLSGQNQGSAEPLPVEEEDGNVVALKEVNTAS